MRNWECNDSQANTFAMTPKQRKGQSLQICSDLVHKLDDEKHRRRFYCFLPLSALGQNDERKRECHEWHWPAQWLWRERQYTSPYTDGNWAGNLGMLESCLTLSTVGYATLKDPVTHTLSQHTPYGLGAIGTAHHKRVHRHTSLGALLPSPCVTTQPHVSERR